MEEIPVLRQAVDDWRRKYATLEQQAAHL